MADTELYVAPKSAQIRALQNTGVLNFAFDASLQATRIPYMFGYEWRIGVVDATRAVGGEWTHPLFDTIVDLVLAQIKPYGARTNKHCGLHVHVSSLFGRVRLDSDTRNAMLSTSRWWKTRSMYVSNRAQLSDHYSGIGVRDGLNHIEFRWPNGTISKRGIHHTVRRCLNQYASLWRPTM